MSDSRPPDLRVFLLEFGQWVADEIFDLHGACTRDHRNGDLDLETLVNAYLSGKPRPQPENPW